MNHYLTTLSLINDKRDFLPMSYSSDLGEFSGCLSNEAPLKYEITRLARNNEMFDYILIFASEEVINLARTNASGLTTIAYFKKFIIEYLDSIKSDYPIIDSRLASFVDTKDFVEKTVRILPISNNSNEKEEWGKIIDFLQDSFDPDSSNNYYMDFTGGSRVTSLMVTLLPHLLEMYGASVKQIIYADINKDKRIVDLTSYYTIIREYEMAYKEDSHSQKLTTWKNLGGHVSEDTVNDVKEIDSFQKEESINLSKNKTSLNTKKKDVSKKSNIEKAMVHSSIKEAEKVAQSTPFDKLLKQKNDVLIKNFRESIVDIFIDQEILVPVKKIPVKKFKLDVKSQLEASDAYYEKYDKKNILISGVIFQLQKLFSDLNKNDKDPVEAYNSMFDLTTINLVNPTYAVGASRFHTKSFLDYIDRNDIMLKDEDSFSYMDWFENYHELLNIYLSFGFPFACTGRAFTYREVENHYRKEVKNLLSQLSNLRKTNPSLYKEKIQNYTSIQSLEEVIPEKVNFNFWKTNRVNASFETTLIHRIQEVRPFRNAISHNLNRDLKKEEEMANKIRTWILEYQKI